MWIGGVEVVVAVVHEVARPAHLGQSHQPIRIDPQPEPHGGPASLPEERNDRGRGPGHRLAAQDADVSNGLK
jgi:hypothetical protein